MGWQHDFIENRTEYVRLRQRPLPPCKGAALLPHAFPSRPPGRESIHVATFTRAESLSSPRRTYATSRCHIPVSHSSQDNEAVRRQFHLNPAVLAGQRSTEVTKVRSSIEPRVAVEDLLPCARR
jgi:hypothetical protein